MDRQFYERLLQIITNEFLQILRPIEGELRTQVEFVESTDKKICSLDDTSLKTRSLDDLLISSRNLNFVKQFYRYKWF